MTGIEVHPSHFSPDGDGQNDETEVIFTPTGAATSVTVDVDVMRIFDGMPFGTLISGEVRPAGVEIRQTWAPGAIGDDRYRFVIQVTEGTETASASADVEADSTPPMVSFGLVGPSPFDPEAAPLFADVEVISDSTTITTVSVRQLTASIDSLGTVAGADTATVEWDGKNTAGVLVASGTYELRADARDLAGNTDTASRSITVDRLAPTLTVDSPDTVQTASFPVSIRGRAIDEDAVARVEASFDSSQTFVLADSASSSGSIVTFRVDVDDGAPLPGFRRVVLRALDVYGHATVDSVVVAYDTVLPVPISSTLVDADGVVADGDSLEIGTLWNLTGLDITVDFGELDDGWSVGREVATEVAAGAYYVLYEVTSTNGVRAGSHDVIITGSTGIVAGRDTVQVFLADRHGEDLVAVDRNRFDPLAGEAVRISAESDDANVSVEVYDLAGRRVRLLSGAGFVEWDGRNGDGEAAASSVYLLRVKVDGEEETRKVAVTRGGVR
ncbi:MAG: hypothetical protein ACT4PE_14890 [Candidatus Eiseniibacteriota bacterium]